MLERLSPDVSVMFRPKKTFAELGLLPHRSGAWLFWRRPLLFVLVFCGGISLMTAGRLSLHLVGSPAIYWMFLPVVEIAGLVAAQRGRLEARLVDRFFTGHGPWFLFIIAFAAYASSPSSVVMTPTTLNLWVLAVAFVLLWSCWIDYRFFDSVRKLATHRAVSWTLFAAIFAGSWLWNEIAWRLGL
jgi:hypothetical protein